jgi:hypothetical protein
MFGLGDLVDTEALSLSDVQPDAPSKPLISNKASNIHLGVQAAALSGQDPVAIYHQVNAEMDSTGDSPTYTSISEATKAQVQKDDAEVISSILVDPSISDEQKREAFKVATDKANPINTASNVLASKALSKDSEGETPRAAELRQEIADSLAVVNKQKYEEQQLYTAEMNKQSGKVDGPAKAIFDLLAPSYRGKETKLRKGLETAANVGGTIVDLAEMIVPFDDATKTAIVNANASGDSSITSDLALGGDAKDKLRETVSNMPPEKRLELQRHLVDVVNQTGSTVFQNDNDLQQATLLASVLQQGEYGETEKTVDNITSLLDMTILGGAIARAAKSTKVGAAIVAKTTGAGAKVAAATTDRVGNFYRRLVTSRVQPSSVAMTYKDTNPEMARAAYDLAVNSEGDEAALAMYGTTKADMLAFEHLPTIVNPDGSVMAKVEDIARTAKKVGAENEDLLQEANSSGRLDLSSAEKDSARTTVLNRFKSVDGLTAREGMFQHVATGDGMNLRAVYGPTEGGFSTAEDALAMARFALRGEGIADDAIKLLVRDGQDYRVATVDEVNAHLSKDIITHNGVKPKDFLVSVDHAYGFNTADINTWTGQAVKKNLIGRVAGKLGAKITPFFVDRASMFSEQIFGAASVGTDASSHIERALHQMTKSMAELSKKASPEQLKTMDRLMKEGLVKEKEHTTVEMLAAGLTDDQVLAMKEHREFWDTAYQLENASKVKDSIAKGVVNVVDETTNTSLFAKPVHVSQSGAVSTVYDIEKGTFRSVTEEERAALYADGGTFAKMEDPIILQGQAIEHVLVHNKAGRSYAKALNKDTQILNYRKGYYKTLYKDPHFIIKVTRDAKGAIVSERAVATAGSKVDAKAHATALANKNGGRYNYDYYERPDMKGADGVDRDWQVAQSSGRSSQRLRGALLDDASELIRPELSNIEDPITSMIKSARSISAHTGMRDVLETTKERFLKQYGHYIEDDVYGAKRFPSSPDGINYRGEGKAPDAKELADARATHEYIKYLEDGYANSVDDFYKASFKWLADASANLGLSKGEAAARFMSERAGPVGTMKSFAFQAYLGLNPLRQFVIQSHQMMQLLALNHKWFTEGHFVNQTVAMSMRQMGIPLEFIRPMILGSGWTPAEFDEVYKAFQKTGQAASIDKHSMVKGSIMDFADSLNASRSKLGRAWKLVTLPATWSRKLGFDSGEYVTTVTSFLAHRDRAIRNGIDVKNTEEAARIAQQSRNFTYNMNSAGDMKYNHGSLGFVFQFMQVPHKVLLTMMSNRTLTGAERTRLFMFNSVMYSLPPAAMYSWFGSDGLNILPKDGEARKLVVEGLEPWLLNKLISGVSQQNVDVDWSTLSPLDPYGLTDFVHGFLTTDIGALAANSPSGQLFGGNSPRISNAVVEAGRYFHLMEDTQPNPATFGSVVRSVLNISSGMSNAFKTRAALELGKQANQLGGSNSTIPSAQAIWLMFGFQSMDSTNQRWANDEVYQKSKDFKEDMAKVYAEAKRNVIEHAPGSDAGKYATQVQQAVLSTMGSSPAVLREFNSMLIRDFQNKDNSLIKRIQKNMSAYSIPELEELANTIKFDSPEQKQAFINTIKWDFNNRQEGKE